MSKRKKPPGPAPSDLPTDLVGFLAEGRELEYDRWGCEVREVELLSLRGLRLERLPVQTRESRFSAQDPHSGEIGSYLVLGVNLVGETFSAYDPVGILMWLPIEQRYGVWSAYDEDRIILLFGPEVTWTHIAADPVRHINAGWPALYPDAAPVEELLPWLSHPFTPERLASPQPADPSDEAPG